MARPSGSTKILLLINLSDVSLIIFLINKLDTAVKKKTDEFKKFSF